MADEDIPKLIEPSVIDKPVKLIKKGILSAYFISGDQGADFWFGCNKTYEKRVLRLFEVLSASGYKIKREKNGGTLMAFKVLNDEEKLLLDDNQRMQYEKELNLYQQRAAFVECLEKFESTHIETYEPKLESIYVINEKEIKPFPRIEYVVTVCEPEVRTDLHINSFKQAEYAAPALPVMPSQINVKTKDIQKIENIHPCLPDIEKLSVSAKYFEKPKKQQPDMPAINKTDIVVTSFKMPEKNYSDIPFVVSPTLKTDISFEQLRNNMCYIPDEIPDVIVPGIDINDITLPEEVQISLPEVFVYSKETDAFIKPELQVAELPAVDMPGININYNRDMKAEPPVVPDISAAFHSVNAFQIPELQNIELPAVDKPDVDIYALKKTGSVVLNLPNTSNIDLQLKKFSKPEKREIDLPAVCELKIGMLSFEKPESKKSELPATVKVSVQTRAFKKAESIQPKVVTPSIPCAQVKIFTKPQINISKLPEMSAAEIPDMHLRLKEMHLM